MARTDAAPGGVFISYRREDSAFAASYLYDRLSEKFGARSVFKDVEAILPGDDFVREITDAVTSCDCLVAVIGPRWLAATDDNGRRRIDRPDDYVRLEIEAALQRAIRVIPVCTDGARMPESHELPPGLQGLARRNALVVTATSVRSDVARLIEAVEATRPGSGRPRWRRLAVAAAPVLVLAALAAWWLLPEAPDVTSVTVPGAQQWTGTGIDVTAGDRITVTATGQIDTDVDFPTGPDGFPNRPELLTLLPSANHGGLLGRVGDSAPVFLGAEGELLADRAGEILLGINDLGLENNSGAFQALVTTPAP